MSGRHVIESEISGLVHVAVRSACRVVRQNCVNVNTVLYVETYMRASTGAKWTQTRVRTGVVLTVGTAAHDTLYCKKQCRPPLSSALVPNLQEHTECWTQMKI